MIIQRTALQDEFACCLERSFYRKDATLELPIYLDPQVRDYLAERAKAKGIEVNQLVNDLLKRDIELIETAK